MDESLIEEERFDLIKLFQLVGADAKKEKLAIPPINQMLYWWTRKPLIVARMVALASTLQDIKEVKYLLNIHEDNRAFFQNPDVQTYTKWMGKEPSSIKILDPFGGAGNLIFEAKRLGLSCYSMDYNPVAYLIQKSVLEYPPKYGIKLAEDVEKYAKEMMDNANKEIGKFFRRAGRKPLSFVWIWCIRCPYCNQRVPLVNYMWLAKGVKKMGIVIHLTEDLNFQIEIKKGMSEDEGKKFTQKKGKAICIRCRNSISNVQLTKDISLNRDREMIAVVVQGVKGKDYEVPTDEDKEIYRQSERYLKELYPLYESQGLIPNESILANRENTLSNYGIKKWNQFFSDRQLLVIITFLKNIIKISESIEDSEYAKAICIYLAFMLCKHVNRNALGVGWEPLRESIYHALTFRRPIIVYNHAESNPFEKTSGSIIGIIDEISQAIRFASLSKTSCTVSLDSVLNLSSKYDCDFDIIITDPPYADDVQYGELSDFFYVWLYRALKHLYPELPARVPLNEDLCVSIGRFGNKSLANDYYKKGMGQAFKQIYKSLKDDGLLVLFFAHSSTEAWNLLLETLRNSRLRVVSSYAVHTESSSNVIAIGKTSFMSSIVVGCRKIHEEKSAYFEDILPEIEEKVRHMLMNITLPELLELPMTDLLIMTYGKVLEETTQHTILKSYRSDFKPEFESLIKDSREFILKEIVTKLTGRSPNILGPDLSFYMIAKCFYGGILDSNEAIKIAWAYSINLDDLERKQVASKQSGVTQLLFFDEIHTDKKPEEIDRNNLHEQLLYLENIADLKGVKEVQQLVSQHTNFRVQDLKQVINLLIQNYRMQLNKTNSLSVKQQKELKILESLADIFKSSFSPLKRRESLEDYWNEN